MSETQQTARVGCPHCKTWGPHKIVATPDLDVPQVTSLPTHVFKCSLCGGEFDNTTVIDAKDECERVIPE